jgi:hypothetical protein
VNRSNKWLKRSLWTVALLLVVGAGLSAMSYVMIRRTPDWYHRDKRTEAELRTASGKLENMLIELRNWGSEHHAAQVQSQQAINAATTRQAKIVQSRKADEAFNITFTDDQLNAFFNKWENYKERREWLDQYVDDPQLVIRGNQLIIVGKVKALDTVVSLVFEPRLEEHGELNLNLVHVLGGVLPLPDAMWANQRHAIEKTLQSKLPEYQQDAKISPEGIANGDAASASMNQLLLATLHYKPASAVIFIPIELEHLSQSLPVKITAVSIHDHTVDMTAEQMNDKEREAFLKKLKEPEESAK